MKLDQRFPSYGFAAHKGTNIGAVFFGVSNQGPNLPQKGGEHIIRYMYQFNEITLR